jgi:hypothetical protein
MCRGIQEEMNKACVIHPWRPLDLDVYLSCVIRLFKTANGSPHDQQMQSVNDPFNKIIMYCKFPAVTRGNTNMSGVYLKQRIA